MFSRYLSNYFDIPAQAPTSNTEKGNKLSDTKTTLEKENKVLKNNWQPRQKYSRMSFHHQLAANEFLSEDEQISRQTKSLSLVLAHAEKQIPYYKDLFKNSGTSSQDINVSSDLTGLPVLTKFDIQNNADRLRAQTLPPGHTHNNFTQSSGTTGRPTRVYQTNQSNLMFTLLKQRELRWFRFNPMSSLASIRLPSQLPRHPEGKEIQMGETFRLQAWPYVGRYFQTGPYLCYSVINPVDDQAVWLSQRQPDYLLTYSETLEHLAFAYKNKETPGSIKALIAISEQLTPGMRTHIESKFSTPIFQNYGLNEAGIVAARCKEGGRYHVHTEHCMVEIVDDNGLACSPGKTGKIVVTVFSNLAMPLIRYDTDDLAQAVEGPCPCGRTLPSFGEIEGRYSRIAFLPENTLALVGSIREALEKMPAELSKNLRQFQIHQFKDDSFELRLFTPGGMNNNFPARIQSAWLKAIGNTQARLNIIEVKEIPRGPGGKFQDFTSDYFPKSDREEPA